MRKTFIVILALAIIIFLRVNYVWPQEYVFRHGIEMVDRVELLYNQSEEYSDGYESFEFQIIRELQGDELISFMNEVYMLDTAKGGYPPRWGYGWYVAKVTYSNGDVEMLGSYNIEFISSGKEQTGVGRYYFTGDAFEETFSRYVATENYPTT